MSLTNTLKLGAASALTLLLSTSAYAGETLGLDDVPGAQEYLLAVPGATVEDAIQAMSPDNLQKVVHRHINCHRFRPVPRETLLIMLVDIKRRLCGIASVGVR